VIPGYFVLKLPGQQILNIAHHHHIHKYTHTIKHIEGTQVSQQCYRIHRHWNNSTRNNQNTDVI